jgi:hypothetical protein
MLVVGPSNRTNDRDAVAGHDEELVHGGMLHDRTGRGAGGNVLGAW